MAFMYNSLDTSVNSKLYYCTEIFKDMHYAIIIIDWILTMRDPHNSERAFYDITCLMMKLIRSKSMPL